MENTKKRTVRIDGQKTVLIVAILLIGLIATLINPKFITSRNISNIFQQISVLGILTMGQAMLVIMGCNDLSYGGIMGIIGSVVWLQTRQNMNIAVIILTALAIGCLCGFLNGLIVSFSKCIPLIITLGMQYLYLGITMIISNGNMMNAGGRLTFLKKIEFIHIPLLIYVFLIIVIVFWILLNNTRYGRRIVAIGGNSENAFLSGIAVQRYIVLNYMISGATVAVAMLVLLGRTDALTASVGDGYALRAMSAAVIGGVSFSGGKGSISGAFLGCVLMGIISNAMNVVGLSGYYQTSVEGLIIVVAVTLSNWENIVRK